MPTVPATTVARTPALITVREAKKRGLQPITHGYHLDQPSEVAAMERALAHLRAGWIEHALVNAGQSTAEIWRSQCMNHASLRNLRKRSGIPIIYGS